jgi:protease I
MTATTPPATLAVAMIIAPDKPRDEEFKVPFSIFTGAHCAVTVFSTTIKPVTGMLGGVFKPDRLLSTLDVAAFDAIVFVGGGGAQVYIDDPVCHAICTKAVAQKKVLAAICIAPAILARAGVLKGKRATVWEGAQDQVVAGGATLVNSPAVTDGLLVTGNGPQSAEPFARAVLAALGPRAAK